MMGSDSASAVLKTFDREEVELITAEMTKLSLISQELQRDMLAEFSEVAMQAGTSLSGGLDFTRASLEKALGVSRATDILNRIAPSRDPPRRPCRAWRTWNRARSTTCSGMNSPRPSRWCSVSSPPTRPPWSSA
jgi:flagellar motor switch protein FliG